MLIGHLFYKVTFPFSQRRALNTGLNVYVIPVLYLYLITYYITSIFK